MTPVLLPSHPDTWETVAKLTYGDFKGFMLRLKSLILILVLLIESTITFNISNSHEYPLKEQELCAHCCDEHNMEQSHGHNGLRGTLKTYC